MRIYAFGLSFVLIVVACCPADAQEKKSATPRPTRALPRLTFSNPGEKVPQVQPLDQAEATAENAGPLEPAPLFGVVQEVLPNGMKALISVVEYQPETQTRTVKVTVDGVVQERQEAYTVEVPIPRLREFFIFSNFGTAVRGGKSVPLNDALATIKRDDVFLCTNSEQIHPAYAQLLRPGGLILVRPILHAVAPDEPAAGGNEGAAAPPPPPEE
jgi:hypothetical protein